MQVEEESVKVGFKIDDALFYSFISNVECWWLNQIAAGLRLFWPPSLVGILPDFLHWCLYI